MSLVPCMLHTNWRTCWGEERTLRVARVRLDTHQEFNFLHITVSPTLPIEGVVLADVDTVELTCGVSVHEIRIAPAAPPDLDGTGRAATEGFNRRRQKSRGSLLLGSASTFCSSRIHRSRCNFAQIDALGE